MASEAALQVVEKTPATLSRQSLEPNTLQEAIEFSKMIAESDLVPRDYKGKPANILVAIQFGKELGVAPLQALQGIAVINSRPSVWGDLMWALVTSHPQFEDAKEDVTDTGATITLRRRGRSPVTVSFTKADAEKAGLWGKQGPWTQYPKRQMQWRARTFAARDLFPDALKGLTSAEEVMDYDSRTIEAQSVGSASVPTAAQSQGATTLDTIGTEKATIFYKAYRSHGWTVEDSRKFLKDTFGIAEPRTSKDIPASQYEKAMAWATTNSPTREEADKLFSDIGFTMDEQAAFCNEQKWNFANIVAELKKKWTERNQAEQ